jgi:cyclopropane fatty-acyl-phospholipid synthase-like methyltransferase
MAISACHFDPIGAILLRSKLKTTGPEIMGKKKAKIDRHLLYSAAVQSVESDLDFFRRVYRRMRGRHFKLLREDFCGTAALTCEWVRRGKDHRAWGIDFDRKTLDWGIDRYLSKLGPAADRVTLLCENVLTATTPPVDVIAALNFSFCTFKERSRLREYFKKVRSSLLPGGLFFLDIFGGTEAIDELEEDREVEACKAFDGTDIPDFIYHWEQASYNPIDHHILCYIHFELEDGTRINRAFKYDWRLWTIPEIREIMEEAGFESTEVYVEGWDEDDDDSDGVFRRRVSFENQSGWVAYVVGVTAQ